LFERVANPIGEEVTPGVWLASQRLVAIDGLCLDVAGMAVNAERFGRPGVNKGEQAAVPQARIVALAECGTHAVFAAEVGINAESEAVLAKRLIDRLHPGMLLTADRGFFSYALWREATGTGADLLWRIRTDKSAPKPIHVQDLPEGSWLADLRQTHSATARRVESMRVRVIDYSLDYGRDNPETTGSSRRCSIPMRRPRSSLWRPTPNAGRSSSPSMKSRLINAGRAQYCAASPRIWCSRKSGAACAATSRSDPW